MNPDLNVHILREENETRDDLLGNISPGKKSEVHELMVQVDEIKWKRDTMYAESAPPQCSTEMQHSQTTPLKRTYESIKDEVIDAVPLSFRLPDDAAIIVNTPIYLKNIINPPKVKIGSSSGNSASTPRSRRFRTPEYLENWQISRRTRPNGRVDKFYYHKIKDVMCRSMKEVERFETQGIRPTRKGKGKEKSSTNEDTKEMIAEKKKKRKAEKMRIAVEKFLADAYNNHLRLFDGCNGAGPTPSP